MQISELKSFNLNFGPQHPAAHGVLRLILKLQGETIQSSDAHIGLLHRGTEKLIENKTIMGSLPYVDRLDYVSMFSNEHVFSQGIEKILLLSISLRSQYVRVFLLEITRILNHIMCLTTHAMDVGALTPFLWFFEEREKLMELYEKLSGARMHAAFIRPGGLATDLPKNVLQDCVIFCKNFIVRIEEMEILLTNNRIFKKRLTNIAVLSKKIISQYAITGPMLRSIGLSIDLRAAHPYEIYPLIPFNVIIAQNGDSFSRYFIRLEEFRESLKIIYWVVNNLPTNQLISYPSFFLQKKQNKRKQSMETLIFHFTNIVKNQFLTSGEFFVSVEAPKGILGLFLVTNSTPKLYRCKFRAPGFFHLQAFDKMSKHHSLADAVAIIGTQDIVFGEVDR